MTLALPIGRWLVPSRGLERCSLGTTVVTREHRLRNAVTFI